MSNETALSVSFPLDSDGFLRRQCPHCQQEFKWLGVPVDGDAPRLSAFYCPYCGQSASVDEALTTAQREYAVAIVKRQMLGPMLEDFMQGLSNDLNRPGSAVTFTGGEKVKFPSPSVLIEDNDMRRIVFPCHPDTPVKIAEDWGEAVHCLVCGQAYAAE